MSKYTCIVGQSHHLHWKRATHLVGDDGALGSLRRGGEEKGNDGDECREEGEERDARHGAGVLDVDGAMEQAEPSRGRRDGVEAE